MIIINTVTHINQMYRNWFGALNSIDYTSSYRRASPSEVKKDGEGGKKKKEE